MKNKKIIAFGMVVAVSFAMSGCGNKENTTQVTPTPSPVLTSTPIPQTPTPTPKLTLTPAPKLIGQKTETASSIALENSTEVDLKEIYIQVSGTTDWGKNLIPSESSVKESEEVQMYYEPTEGALYNIKVVTKAADTFEIYSVDLSDMEKASLHIENGSAYLSYMSLSTRSESTTLGNYSYIDDSSLQDETENAYGTNGYNDQYTGNYYDDSYNNGYGNGNGYVDNNGNSNSGDSNYGQDSSGGNSSDNSGNSGGTVTDDTGDSGSGDGTGTGNEAGTGGTTDGSGDSTGGGIVWDEDGNWSEY